MRTVTFAGLLLLATGASAQYETWDCRSGSGQSENSAVLASLTVNDDRQTGEIFVIETVYDARFGIRGFDRWWSFTDGGEDSYTFRIEPNGAGYYNVLSNSGGASSTTQSYSCRQRQGFELETARELEEKERLNQEAARARQQAETDPELQRLLVLEDERRRANETQLLDEYVRSVEDRIYENWIRPASAEAGLVCVVNLTLAPSGDVVAVLISHCIGDEVVAESIEAAVLRSSPIPSPIPALYERNLKILFSPDL